MKSKKIIVIILILLGISCLVFLSLKKRKKLNVILIVVDALRADHLGCYGYRLNTSPNIDRFAKEGILFRNAFSHGPQTFVSVPSILTSLYPGVHRILSSGLSLDNKIITLPEIFKKNGYRTAAFVGPQLGNISNLRQRFELYVEDRAVFDKNMASRLNKQALNWINTNLSKPFFIYLHYLDVHNPYDPAIPYDRIFYNEEVDNETKRFVHELDWGGVEKQATDAKKLVDHKYFEYFISQYDGKIRFIDEQIGILLKRLENYGLLDETLVVLTSDHGDEFLEHGQIFHQQGCLYDELIHVPLIMRLPRIIPKNKVITNQVRHVDIMPTILGVLNIKYQNIIQGVNIIPLIRGKSNLKLEWFGEIGKVGKRLLKAVRKDNRKFIEIYDYRDNLYYYELYDLESDPKELKNLTEDRPREVELFKTKLKVYSSSCDKVRESMLDKNHIGKVRELDEEAKKNLKTLGYLN